MKPGVVIVRIVLAVSAALAAAAFPAMAQAADPDVAHCSQCEQWNQPQEPFALYGNTYYVGVHGLSAVLVTSAAGHILIDGGLPQSAPLVAANIGRLGFKLADVKYILNSHTHFDHAGAISALQRMTGAEVLASPASAAVLKKGTSGPDDPQYGGLLSFPSVAHVRTIADGQVVRLGPLALTAHFTPGHTPGGTSWTWQSQEGGRKADMVYADSVTAYAAGGFLYSGNTRYPQARADIERSMKLIGGLSCDVLVSAHPEASGLWQRKQAQPRLGNAAFIDRDACRAYAGKGRDRLAEELGEEAAAARH